MDTLLALVVLAVVCLLALACVPTRTANAGVRTVRAGVTLLVSIQLMLGATLAVGYVTTSGPALWWSMSGQSLSVGNAIEFYYDGATALMLVLVSFVGFVVCRYSIRYLDGELGQGRYFRWLGFTIGAVSLMVMAGNLLLFLVAWILTSLGLHQLLLQYPERTAAHRAAWTKFAISRLGDAFLILAFVLIYQTFGTLQLPTLFASAAEVTSAGETIPSHAAIGWLLVMGAATKSAQFPFHIWLPDTMETPTPVSALMHAGIVNAGGYLIIRMSPLIELAPSALVALALLGAFTACFAGIIMMTQPAVKRGLAYSTIAQMGFMMLQCGLGAYSAAMLHILAHSLYKAHAFLGSGSVVSQARAVACSASPEVKWPAAVAYFIGAMTTALLSFSAVAYVTGFDATSKPGGVVLAFLLCLALSTWGWRLWALGTSRGVLASFISLTLLCMLYVGSYLAVQDVIEHSGSVVAGTPDAQFLPLAITIAILLPLALLSLLIWPLHPVRLEAFRVHALNGFYVDAVYRRLFSNLV
jgi:NAD(P)H-quinone oxidoreductase subunit 5